MLSEERISFARSRLLKSHKPRGQSLSGPKSGRHRLLDESVLSEGKHTQDQVSILHDLKTLLLKLSSSLFSTSLYETVSCISRSIVCKFQYMSINIQAHYYHHGRPGWAAFGPKIPR